ncbi:hypothetical protein LguiB_012659 [Lonicera macranthoides]
MGWYLIRSARSEFGLKSGKIGWGRIEKVIVCRLYLSYDFPAVGGNVLQLELNLFIQVDGNFMLFRQS